MSTEKNNITLVKVSKEEKRKEREIERKKKRRKKKKKPGSRRIRNRNPRVLMRNKL